VLALALATPGHATIGALTVATAFGLLVGIAGHLFRSRTMVITGILIIGGVAAYFLASGYSVTLSK
jgi:hypothetical protein